MLRRGIVLAAVAVALAALIYTAAFPSLGGPVNLNTPYVEATPWPAENLRVVSHRDDWRSPRDQPFHLAYSWLRCDLKGANCVPLAGLHAHHIVPPQELSLVAIRGVVTASDGVGSATVVSRNFYFDDATRPRASRAEIRPLVYDPLQLRHWYGLRPSQNGAGQTIVVMQPWPTHYPRRALHRFSAHFGLPNARLAVISRGKPLYYPDPYEDEDFEWAHAIAPLARIVIVHARYASEVLRIAGNPHLIPGAHVLSSSWRIFRSGVPGTYSALARDCHRAQTVCTFPSGDERFPGDPPSNSPYVLAVGGVVFRAGWDGAPVREAYWRGGGFGPTAYPQPRPVWQGSGTHRVVPDVSGTAWAVTQYAFPPGTQNGKAGWFLGAGTSLASPLWAGLIAVADQELARAGRRAIGIDELHDVLYRGWVSAGLDNLGQSGWDKHTGWGSPKRGIVDVLVRAIDRYRASRAAR